MEREGVLLDVTLNQPARKAGIDRALEGSLDNSRDYKASLQAIARLSEATLEAGAAFFQKRDPNFRGRWRVVIMTQRTPAGC